MPNTHSTLTALFSDIADSIRSKTGQSGTIVADNFPTAIDGITTPVLQSKSATPSLSTQTITPDSPNNGLSSVSVSAVTKELLATLDSDFVAENIKKDVDLFGLIGTLEGGGGASPSDYRGFPVVTGTFTPATNITSDYALNFQTGNKLHYIAGKYDIRPFFVLFPESIPNGFNVRNYVKYIVATQNYASNHTPNVYGVFKKQSEDSDTISTTYVETLQMVYDRIDDDTSHIIESLTLPFNSTRILQAGITWRWILGAPLGTTVQRCEIV